MEKIDTKAIKSLLDDLSNAPTKEDGLPIRNKLEEMRSTMPVSSYAKEKLTEAIAYATRASGQSSDKDRDRGLAVQKLYQFVKEIEDHDSG